jgi:hypothetical protein
VSVLSLLFDSTKETVSNPDDYTHVFILIYLPFEHTEEEEEEKKRRAAKEKNVKEKQELKQQLGRLIIDEEGV